MQHKVIAFSGLDGAGKTTQIEVLMERLKDDGVASSRVWARGGYTPGFEFCKRTLRRIRPTLLPPSGPSPERTRHFGKKSVREVWLIVAMIDMIIYYGVWVRWLCLRGYVVLADRWIQDTELDFRLTFPETNPTRWLFWRMAKRLVPKPSLHFVFLISVDESVRRSIEKQEPFPDSAETLTDRLAGYKKEVAEVGMIEIDCSRSRDAVHDDVWRHIQATEVAGRVH